MDAASVVVRPRRLKSAMDHPTSSHIISVDVQMPGQIIRDRWRQSAEIVTGESISVGMALTRKTCSAHSAISSADRRLLKFQSEPTLDLPRQDALSLWVPIGDYSRRHRIGRYNF